MAGLPPERRGRLKLIAVSVLFAASYAIGCVVSATGSSRRSRARFWPWRRASSRGGCRPRRESAGGAWRRDAAHLPPALQPMPPNLYYVKLIDRKRPELKRRAYERTYVRGTARRPASVFDGGQIGRAACSCRRPFPRWILGG